MCSSTHLFTFTSNTKVTYFEEDFIFVNVGKLTLELVYFSSILEHYILGTVFNI